MKCAYFCFGVFDDTKIPTTYVSETTQQYKDLYPYTAESVQECVEEKITSECNQLITNCSQDQNCKTSFSSFSTCLSQNAYCSHKYVNAGNNPKQRVTCPSTCTPSTLSFVKHDKFDKLLQCFSYCYGSENAIYFPSKTGLDQYISLKTESQKFIPSVVNSCLISECNSSLTKCISDNACNNSYTLFKGCLVETSLCQFQANSSEKLWNICPTTCSSNVTESSLTDSLQNCYQYCYGTEFDDTLFQPKDKSLELYGYTKTNDKSEFSLDVSSATYLFCSDFSRCKNERQAIGAATFIIYLVYIIFFILNLNRKLNENQFYYLESFLFLFGFSSLMSVNYIQSGIFHAIFCYLTFICLLLIFASTIQGNQICEGLNAQRKFIWLAAILFIVIWNLGNIINYYYVGHKHVE